MTVLTAKIAHDTLLPQAMSNAMPPAGDGFATSVAQARTQRRSMEAWPAWCCGDGVRGLAGVRVETAVRLYVDYAMRPRVQDRTGQARSTRIGTSSTGTTSRMVEERTSSMTRPFTGSSEKPAPDRRRGSRFLPARPRFRRAPVQGGEALGMRKVGDPKRRAGWNHNDRLSATMIHATATGK